MRIPKSAIADMVAHAREEAPRECCGLLIGNAEAIERSVRARNIDDRATRYLIDPDDHFAAIRSARLDDREVIGAYHSHPASGPVPSATDIAEANSGSEFIYVIVSLMGEDVRAYRVEDGAPVVLPLVIGDRPLPIADRRSPP
ncbi:MAG TPA: M67 family metallopeptidase [Vicinamibacterales bacterium]|nr:M67 family metallopeptidase [Vicinamibacterales bacterium]